MTSFALALFLKEADSRNLIPDNPMQARWCLKRRRSSADCPGCVL